MLFKKSKWLIFGDKVHSLLPHFVVWHTQDYGSTRTKHASLQHSHFTRQCSDAFWVWRNL